MRRANASIGVDGGYSSPRSADALMKGNLNPEGERICPLAASDGKPRTRGVGFSNEDLDPHQCADWGVS
jgi:hypothetical protein